MCLCVSLCAWVCIFLLADSCTEPFSLLVAAPLPCVIWRGHMYMCIQWITSSSTPDIPSPMRLHITCQSWQVYVYIDKSVSTITIPPFRVFHSLSLYLYIVCTVLNRSVTLSQWKTQHTLWDTNACKETKRQNRLVHSLFFGLVSRSSFNTSCPSLTAGN